MKNKIISNDYKTYHSLLSLSLRWSHKCKINLFLSSLCSSWFIKSHQENNAFITPHGIFCYKVMPYGLKTFMDCQIRYLSLEKLVLALVLTLRKLMHYFQAHSHHCVYGVSAKKYFIKGRFIRSTFQISYRAWTIKYKILTKGSNKGIGLGRFRG